MSENLIGMNDAVEMARRYMTKSQFDVFSYGISTYENKKKISSLELAHLESQCILLRNVIQATDTALTVDEFILISSFLDYLLRVKRSKKGAH